MKNDFLTDFVQQISEQKKIQVANEKRRKYFQNIGRKGGQNKKTSKHLTKKFSLRFSRKEFEILTAKAGKNNLKLSEYIRMVLTEKELKINEFKIDQTLLEYGNHFIRISNLLRNREFLEFENKKEIMEQIETVTKLIRDYLYEKIDSQRNNDE
ncbi:Uncharacterised protein [Chryseobacterium taklimakanense]|uniref:Special sigma factor n=1 Tax=Chryseobacterium taklimakanense TaxID=536441 RepID=A0A239WL02_9FLAO|nr:special sigma factor [Chryseobacterium taklimakanense]SNV35191.1 Uncharacterised protein [Chryseobacterium taklimakanense]